ncbi:DUF2853 family protein [Fretibacter rubidus]|uniref:DUF2853 family protein n=1 Tax=Fretibacter rubidus TaxID=570162 RepID=UPI00352BCC30
MNTTFKKAATTYNGLAPVKTVRRARRAYVGLHGLMFERAQMRAAQARQLTSELFADLVVKGELIEAKASVTAKETQAKVITTVKDTALDGRDAVVDMLPSAKSRVSALEAEVDALEAKLSNMAKVAAKPAKAKTPVVKKDTAKAKATKTDDKYASFIADVQGYDADADVAVIKKIVNYCGIALQSRDGMFVACSDETERNTVRDSLLVKKFGMTDAQSELDALVMAVCETMQKDRMKNRVTFYYLLAKNEGKLAAF